MKLNRRWLIIGLIIFVVAVALFFLFGSVEMGPVESAAAAPADVECYPYQVVEGYQEMVPPVDPGYLGDICATMRIDADGQLDIRSGWVYTSPLFIVHNGITTTYPTTKTQELAPQLLPTVIEVVAGDEVTWIPTTPGTGTQLGVRFEFTPEAVPTGCLREVVLPGDTFKEWAWPKDSLPEDLCVEIAYEVPGTWDVEDGAVLHAPLFENGIEKPTTPPTGTETADRIVPFVKVITDTAKIDTYSVSPGSDGSGELKFWFTFTEPQQSTGCLSYEIEPTATQVTPNPWTWDSTTHPDDYCVTFTMSTPVGGWYVDSGWAYNAPVYDESGVWRYEPSNDGISADQLLQKTIYFTSSGQTVTVYVTPTEDGFAELGLRFTADDQMRIFTPLIQK